MLIGITIVILMTMTIMINSNLTIVPIMCTNESSRYTSKGGGGECKGVQRRWCSEGSLL